jgi:hypothetical protein
LIGMHLVLMQVLPSRREVIQMQRKDLPELAQ